VLGPSRFTGGSRRSGRAISEVTATVLLVIITLAIAGVVYVFLTFYFGTIP
jgi:flagellin-like protein